MKILHITNAYPYQKYPAYGIFIKEQIDSLINNGVDCDIIFINSKANGIIEYLISFIKNRTIIKKYDIIHFHHPYSAFLYLLFNKQKHNQKYITSFLNTVNHSGFKIISKIVLKKSDKIIVKDNSNLRLAYPGKIEYLPNGVNLTFFKPMKKYECFSKLKIPDANYVLFCSAGGIGRKQKRYDLFKKVIEIANKKYNSNFKELLLINAERKLVPYYYNAASVHLLTSDFEGSPNSVKEALACNIPVVSRNVGNVKKLLGDYSKIYISKTSDPNELAELLVKAYKNKNSFNGREIIKQQGLDIDSIARKLIKIYNDL